MKQIVEKINEADLILIGLGEELDTLTLLKHDSQYQRRLETIENSWLAPYMESVEIKKHGEEIKDLYTRFSNCLKGKNYFIVSLCRDGLVRESGFDAERIVEPCGGYGKMQCSVGCSAELYDVPEDILRQVEGYLNEIDTSDVTKKEIDIPDYIKEPVCPHCGKPLVFNNVAAAHYVEEGYLPQWSVYKKWLQGTVNKKVCLLELGVGMKYPTVIRWPFEKIAFYNQKAELIRVHDRLYQLTEEIKGKGIGICRKPEEFMKELSNVF